MLFLDLYFDEPWDFFCFPFRIDFFVKGSILSTAGPADIVFYYVWCWVSFLLTVTPLVDSTPISWLCKTVKTTEPAFEYMNMHTVLTQWHDWPNVQEIVYMYRIR